MRNYRCPHYLQGNRVEGCTRQIAVSKLDAELWRKVSIVLTHDLDFGGWVQMRIEELRRDESDAQARIDRIQNELGRLANERQWVITQARKKTITDEDMEQQLAMLTAQENELQRGLMDKSLLVGNRAERLLEFVNEYRANLRGKLGWLNSEPQTPEEGERQFKARRQIVEAIVKRVNVYTDKTVKVVFEFDLTGMDEQIKDRQHL